MAESGDDAEKTEEPSHKKLEDAHDRGDVAKSQEVNTWFVLLASTLVMAMFADGMAARLTEGFVGFLGTPHQIRLDPARMYDIAVKTGLTILAAIALPLVVLALAAVAGNLVQHRLVLSLDPIKPKLSKISPLAGAKRLFSTTSLVNFFKGLAKLAVVGGFIFAVVWPQRGELAALISTDTVALLPLVKLLAIKVMVAVLLVMGVVAAADYAYQRSQWMQKQRMTVKELRDEYKQLEGDPAVRAKLRQIRVERGRKRMMASMPQASVVVTNPTHYAVALKYESGMNAPVCLAKGVDAVALRIRAFADEHAIPIVENPPLARALHASVEIDAEIPTEHYKAVAQIIGYVMQLRRKSAWRADLAP